MTTPGHTAGTYGLIFPVSDLGRAVTVAYASGTAFNTYTRPWFDQFIASQRKLATAAVAAKATVLLSNQSAFDDTWAKARLAAWRPAGTAESVRGWRRRRAELLHRPGRVLPGADGAASTIAAAEDPSICAQPEHRGGPLRWLPDALRSRPVDALARLQSPPCDMTRSVNPLRLPPVMTVERSAGART